MYKWIVIFSKKRKKSYIQLMDSSILLNSSLSLYNSSLVIAHSFSIDESIVRNCNKKVYFLIKKSREKSNLNDLTVLNSEQCGSLSFSSVWWEVLPRSDLEVSIIENLIFNEHFSPLRFSAFEFCWTLYPFHIRIGPLFSRVPPFPF